MKYMEEGDESGSPADSPVNTKGAKQRGADFLEHSNSGDETNEEDEVEDDEDVDEDAGYNPFEVCTFGDPPVLSNGFDRVGKLREVAVCRLALATLTSHPGGMQAMADLLQNAPGGGFDVPQFVNDVEAACTAREQWVNATDTLMTSLLVTSRPAKSASMVQGTRK